VVATLRAGARLASERGAPDTAASYLRRALEESPPPAVRGPLLLELGLALMAANRDPQAPALLAEALRLLESPGQKLEAALHAGRALGFASDLGDAVRVLEAGLGDRDTDGEAARLVEGELIAQSLVIARRVTDAYARLELPVSKSRPLSLAARILLVDRAPEQESARTTNYPA